jgi:hypothetical protein
VVISKRFKIGAVIVSASTLRGTVNPRYSKTWL